MAVRLMRVIAGQYRGLRIRAPRGPGTRPATGRVRESVFSALGSVVVGARVLDLYAGSGSFGIESLSRGGRSALFVERSRPALAALRSNLQFMGIGDRAEVAATSVERFVTRGEGGRRFDIVFADPPWDISSETLAGILVLVSRWMNPDAVAIVTRRAGDDVPAVSGMEVADQRRHGDAEVIRYSRE
ncbi:MAG: 16S rRNA (guanine(966)-N(2))-methyltransferase RsmD [bacterium]|nr:16S rRNA (guanine(966)-N(2))-methyltransferase RsmD [Acidimicrobiia bacterium]MCY4649648.1 16S rRNA (guanine(966)-N(2))-methyltransferase RsmD [bacterium]